MVTPMSTLAPAVVGGTAWEGAAPIWSPDTNTHVYPLSQGQLPLLRMRQILSICAPGEKTVPSGTVTSATKAASRVQPVGVAVGVAVTTTGVQVAVGVPGAGVDVATSVAVGWPGVGVAVGWRERDDRNAGIELDGTGPQIAPSP